MLPNIAHAGPKSPADVAITYLKRGLDSQEYLSLSSLYACPFDFPNLMHKPLYSSYCLWMIHVMAFQYVGPCYHSLAHS